MEQVRGPCLHVRTYIPAESEHLLCWRTVGSRLQSIEALPKLADGGGLAIGCGTTMVSVVDDPTVAVGAGNVLEGHVNGTICDNKIECKTGSAVLTTGIPCNASARGIVPSGSCPTPPGGWVRAASAHSTAASIRTVSSMLDTVSSPSWEVPAIVNSSSDMFVSSDSLRFVVRVASHKWEMDAPSAKLGRRLPTTTSHGTVHTRSSAPLCSRGH